MYVKCLWYYAGKEKPNIKDINNYVVPRWAPKWKQLGIQLDIDKHRMDVIEKDLPVDCKDCCIRMFSEWLDINTAACWEHIIIAVDNLSSDGMYVY